MGPSLTLNFNAIRKPCRCVGFNDSLHEMSTHDVMAATASITICMQSIASRATDQTAISVRTFTVMDNNITL